MDRYLFTGALGLLIFQVLYLLADLGLLGSYQLHKEVRENQAPIGRLVKKRQAVKRKALNSLIWEESEKNEQLYRYDSVLTLDDSTAQLELEGDIQLNVHENTLVVLEPMDTESRDDLRVRFQRGLLRARSSSQRMNIGTGDWVVEAQPGSNLSIRALENEQLEVEVNGGKVSLENRETHEVKNFAKGQKLTLDPEEILKEETMDDSLSFIEPQVKRIYTHNFPNPVKVKWNGPAEALQLLSPNQKLEEISLANKSSELLFLNPGTYLLTLRSGKLISPSFTLELKPAPKLKYLHPLPRDRVDILKPGLFSWFQQLGIQEYEIKFESEGQETWTSATDSPYAEIKPPLTGRYEWSVEARDQEGFRIPPYYSIPVYFTDSPLAAPLLNAPRKRIPASKPKQKVKEGAFLDKFWKWLVPKAHADELRVHREVIFTWYPVPGADFYVIEISESEDFLNPKVITKTQEEEYSWANFENKKYFWRVAAGQTKGRMGLFSAAAEFDVPLLKTLKTEDLAPGVRYVETPKPTPAPKPTPVPKPIPAVVEKPAKPVEAKPVPPTEYKLSINADHLSIDQSNDDLDSVEFRGLATLSLSGSRTWWWGEKIWRTDLDLQMLSWKPKNESSFPFQEDINTYFVNLKAYKKVMNGEFWGPTVMLFPVAERADLEEIEVASTVAGGLLYGWHFMTNSGFSWTNTFDFHYGGDLQFAGWENEFSYVLKDDGERQHSFNANIDFRFSIGNEDQLTFWQRVGVSYGIDW